MFSCPVRYIIGSEFEFSSLFVCFGSDVVGVAVLFAKMIDAGETDGISFCNLFMFHAVVASV